MTERERLVELIDNFIDTVDETHWYSEELDERLADYLIANSVIVPPCKVGDEINGEIVHQIEYVETLGLEGKINRKKMVHTCDKDSTEKIIFTSHPIVWEEAEIALKGGAE